MWAGGWLGDWPGDWFGDGDPGGGGGFVVEAALSVVGVGSAVFAAEIVQGAPVITTGGGRRFVFVPVPLSDEDYADEAAELMLVGVI